MILTIHYMRPTVKEKFIIGRGFGRVFFIAFLYISRKALRVMHLSKGLRLGLIKC